MRFDYSPDESQGDLIESLAHLPLVLELDGEQVNVTGVVDSGSTVNVLPYQIGVDLGAQWDDSLAKLELTGNLAHYEAMPLFLTAHIEGLPPVLLAFAWSRSPEAPVLLGQTNFFMLFEVCFYREAFEFELKLR